MDTIATSISAVLFSCATSLSPQITTQWCKAAYVVMSRHIATCHNMCHGSTFLSCSAGFFVSSRRQRVKQVASVSVRPMDSVRKIHHKGNLKMRPGLLFRNAKGDARCKRDMNKWWKKSNCMRNPYFINLYKSVLPFIHQLLCTNHCRRYRLLASLVVCKRSRSPVVPRDNTSRGRWASPRDPVRSPPVKSQKVWWKKLEKRKQRMVVDSW